MGHEPQARMEFGVFDHVDRNDSPLERYYRERLEIIAAPLYHPLRLLQEICMLDQMSGGRLEMGFGRGAAAAEIRFFDVDPVKTENTSRETVSFILKALREGAVDTATGRNPLFVDMRELPQRDWRQRTRVMEIRERIGVNLRGSALTDD